MKQITIHRTLALMKWVCVWAVISSQLSLLPADVAAQEPTSIPTPTPAPTWTPGVAPTNTPPPGASETPTPINPDATPTGRLIDFRVDDDRIDQGDCVQFSWVVRGDIDRVEFDQKDDSKDPLLVAALDDRQECPEEETDYELIVRWLDGTRTSRKIEIDVDADGDGNGGDGSSSSGGGDANAPGGVGEFVPVTPILITTLTPVPDNLSEDVTFQQAVYEGPAGSQLATPAGILKSVKALPETGVVPPSAATEDNFVAIKLYGELWLDFIGRLVMLLSSVSAALVLLVKFLHKLA